MEVVHVQLPYEGVKIAVFEMYRQYSIRKPGPVLHLKELAVAAPCDAVLVLIIVDDLKKFFEEGRHAFLARLLRRRFIHLVIPKPIKAIK